MENGSDDGGKQADRKPDVAGESPAGLLRWLKVHTGHVVTLSILVGIVAGLGAVAFSYLFDEMKSVVLVHGAQYVMPSPGAEGGTAVARPPGRRWFLFSGPGDRRVAVGNADLLPGARG